MIKKQDIFWLIIWIIFIYSTFLKFYGLGYQSFWIDEWYSTITAYFASINNFLPLLGSDVVTFGQYFFVFFQGLFLKIFGYTDFVARLIPFIFSLLLSIVFFIFSREFFKWQGFANLWVALTFFLFSFSNWEIIWARQARFYTLLALLFLVGIYFLWKYFFQEKKNFFYLYWIVTFLGIVFHPFLWSLALVWIICFVFQFVSNQLSDKKLIDNIKNFVPQILTLVIVVAAYLIYSFVIWFFGQWWWVPNPNDLWELATYYIKFYNTHFLLELWVVYLLFFWLLAYWAFKWDIKNILFWWSVFFVNFYVITSQWIIMHSRYMFHLFPVIILLWWYTASYLICTWIDNIKYLLSKNNWFKSLGYGLALFFLLYLLITSFSFSLFPKKTYYIDFTSPQPNFKGAYNYLNKLWADYEVVSWFPHLCYWYNISNPWVCKYWLRVNLTWHPDNVQTLRESHKWNYTWIPYLEDFDSLDLSKTYFVLDNLTMKSAINRELIEYILSSCQLKYEDKGDWQKYNLITLWKCE